MTDEERIQKRREASRAIRQLALRRAVQNMTEVVKLHDECAGTGRIGDGEVCVYCAGTGRVRLLSVSCETPFEDRNQKERRE